MTVRTDHRWWWWPRAEVAAGVVPRT